MYRTVFNKEIMNLKNKKLNYLLLIKLSQDFLLVPRFRKYLKMVLSYNLWEVLLAHVSKIICKIYPINQVLKVIHQILK